MAPDLKAFIDRVIVPALIERFLREQADAALTRDRPPLPKPEVRV